MIHYHRDLALIKNLCEACLVEFIDSNRGRNIVAVYNIELAVYKLTCFDRSSPAWAASIFCVIVIPIIKIVLSIFKLIVAL